MRGRRLSAISVFVLYGLLMVAVSCISLLPEEVLPGHAASMIEYACFVTLVLEWAHSARERLFHPQLRKWHLLITALFLIILFFSRLRRVVFAGIYPIEHYLWYLFYLPNLAIPLVSLYMTQYVGRDENYRLGTKYRLLLIPYALLFLGIMTNESHELAFRLEDRGQAVSIAGRYHVTYLYYIAQVWLFTLATLAIIRLFRVCRKAGLQVYALLPTGFVVVSIVYTILYALNRSKYGVGLVEPPVMTVFMSMGCWECCLQLGLIPSNRDHADCFLASTLPMEILDTEETVCYSSAGVRLLEQRKNRETRSKEFPITGGVCMYREDVTEQSRIVHELRANAETLRVANERLRMQARAKEKAAQDAEHARLLDSALQETQKQTDRVMQLLKAAETGTQPEDEVQRMFAEIAVLSTYIKRHANLQLLSENTKTLPLQELHFCLRESAEALALMPVSMLYTQDYDGAEEVPAALLGRIYNGFEAEIEQVLPTVDRLRMHLARTGSALELTMKIAGGQMTAKELSIVVPLTAGEGTE